MKALNCSLYKANTIIEFCLQKASSYSTISALTLNKIQDNSSLLNVNLNSDYFDKLIYENQIFKQGFISEVHKNSFLILEFSYSNSF
jgi:hypothetical protein